MNLFAARLTGKMLSTEAFEKTLKEYQEHVQRWRTIEKSPELAEYNALKKQVESAEFQKRKDLLKNRKYKDTEEGRKVTAYQKLSSSLSMRGYKYALENENFQHFLQYRERSQEQQEETPITASERRMYNAIFRSAFYKNYLRVLNSPELQQLTELEKEIQTEDFQKRNAFWADAKRWEHSEEYKIEQRYLELANSDDIKFFFESREEKIDWAELFRPAFDDDMSSSKNW